jgi:cytochrome c oxidase subunit 2
MSSPINRRRLLISLALAGLGIRSTRSAGQADEQVIKVTARRFTFNPGEISLKKGRPVRLELSSLDVLMGFNIPDLGVREDMVPGSVRQLRFTPQKAGQFDFYCDIFCGSGHEGMSGVVKVA